MKIKIHLLNGEILESNNNVDKETVVSFIKQSHGDYDTIEGDNCIILLRNIVYIEFENNLHLI